MCVVHDVLFMMGVCVSACYLFFNLFMTLFVDNDDDDDDMLNMMICVLHVSVYVVSM